MSNDIEEMSGAPAAAPEAAPAVEVMVVSNQEAETPQEAPVQAAEPEIESIKRQLRMRGIKFHHRAGLDTLKGILKDELAKAARKAKAAATAAASGNEDQGLAAKTEAGQEKLFLTEEEYRAKTAASMRKSLNRLVRIRVQCMNPAKKSWPGEIISVGSAKAGTFKKYVPYNSDEPYHVPYIIYQEMLNRKCRVAVQVKTKNGMSTTQGKLINEYAIERLPPLSATELKELARKQAMSGSIDKA